MVAALALATAPAWAHPGVSHAHAGPEQPASLWGLAELYTQLGFVHIVPRGLDHVLFVLGLFFARPKLKLLVWQLTSFTLAHSLTLALATFGWIRLPPSIVEPLIALSIAYIAVENVLLRRGGPHRPAIVFGFGLLHGLGFAGALDQAGLPSAKFALALLFFNLGVELGQLFVIGAAAVACAWALRKTWYDRFVATPACCLIAVFGLYWTLERTLL